MSKYSALSHSALKHRLSAAAAQDRTTTVELLGLIGEFDTRKLYLPEGHPSMYAYCVGALKMSEDTAYKRIRAARAARRFPTIHGAIADGRLNLNSVVLLAPHLTEATAAELLAAAEGKRRAEIEQLLASRFPQPDAPFRLEPVQPAPASSEFRQLAARPVAGNAGPPPEHLAARDQSFGQGTALPGSTAEPAAEPLAQPAPSQVVDRARVKPLAPERFALQVTIDQATHDKLRYAQELLGHQIPASDVGGVLGRALDALIHQLEKQKFAATDRPRPPRVRPHSESRNIPHEVKRAVWERDGGQCTYVSQSGHRCEAREPLEFDHIQEFARGGNASVSGIRLRCRAHNQYEAECTYGAEFMRHKRIAPVERRAKARAQRAAAAE